MPVSINILVETLNRHRINLTGYAWVVDSLAAMLAGHNKLGLSNGLFIGNWTWT